jgi:predicted helicase
MNFTNIFKTINTFNDIYKITQTLDNKQKGDLFEMMTYHLFKLSPILNNNLQNIWMYKDIPDKIKQELKLPNKDKGIDLLAQINNEYYTIQCKFRQEITTCITWGELGTFFGLSFGMNDKIKGGFFVTNTYQLCDEVIQSKKITAIYGDFFDDIPKELFAQMTNTSKPRYILKEPYKYQEDCFYDCVDYFCDDDRNKGYIEMACGVGKTLTSYWIDFQMGVKRTVIFVPSLYLLSQFFSDWVNQSYAENKKIKYLLIGSDLDVDTETKQKANGIILYIEPDDIRNYINSTKEKLVVICTYQSSDKLAKACNKKIDFDFGIFDEAHKTVGQVGKLFSNMLTDSKLVIKKRLFMTATPKIYNGNLDDENILSMDNEKYYGKQIYCYNTGYAITNKRLTDYQLITITTSKKEIKEYISNNKLIKINDDMTDENSVLIGSVLLLLKKLHDNTCNHLITYHNTVARAIEFKNLLNQVSDMLYKESKIYINSLDGSISMASRKKIINEYQNSAKGILCSARVLNEGVNIPIVDSICFIDSRFSTIDIVQCIGRALRLYKDKKMAYVFVPTFIEDIAEDNDDIDYGNIVRILKAMKATDEGVIEYFKMKSQGKTAKRNIYVTEKFTVLSHSTEIVITDWNNSLEAKIWNIVDPFDCKFNKLKDWIAKNNKYPSLNSKNSNEKKLSKWCARIKNNKNRLYINQIRQLEELKNWKWRKPSTSKTFDEVYLELEKYVNIHKNIPTTRGQDKTLGKWCGRYRELYKLEKLKKEQIEKLEKIPGWYWSRDEFFDKTYDSLLHWVSKNNKLPIECKRDKLENELGYWCKDRRKLYSKGSLTKEKIEKMEKIPGWYWSKNYDFDENYKLLVDWIEENNYFPNLNKYNNAEFKLASWCRDLRTAYSTGKLDNGKIEKMEKLTGWKWKIKKTKFNIDIQ